MERTSNVERSTSNDEWKIRHSVGWKKLLFLLINLGRCPRLSYYGLLALSFARLRLHLMNDAKVWGKKTWT